jgi:hypothetical protein
MKKKIKHSKIRAFLGMMFSMQLMIILPLLYFSVRQHSGPVQNVMFIIAMLSGATLLILSMIAAFQYKWGNKHSYMPVF